MVPSRRRGTGVRLLDAGGHVRGEASVLSARRKGLGLLPGEFAGLTVRGFAIV
ncbi:hypothetical protein HMPREF1326_01322 [Akkermansia sp. KLE1605]|nr:hypothetical protein HMPREF1326_01322 [Akkermansia sp. KLE1605]